MAKTDPSLLSLARILRLIDDLAAPERDYLMARLAQPAPAPAPPAAAPPAEEPPAVPWPGQVVPRITSSVGRIWLSAAAPPETLVLR